MRTKNIRWVLLLCMAFGIANVAKTQIYSSEECYYSQEGSSSVSYVVKFNGNDVWLKSTSHSTVRSNLAKSKDFYKNEVWTEGKNSVEVYDYDYDRSTSVREVYKQEKKQAIWAQCPYCNWSTHTGCGRHGYTLIGYNYVAFSKDKSSFIKWYEKKNNYDGNINNRKDYSRVPKKDLLPKAVDDIFLY